MATTTRPRDITLYYRNRPPRAASTGAQACYTCPDARSESGALLTEPVELAREIVDLLADRQAEDVVLLDLRRVAPFADYFVIATATNPRHMRALVEALAKELRKEGGGPRHQEGDVDSGWVLIDSSAVIVHLFSPELRDDYSLEELWHAAPPVVRIQ